MKNIFIPTKEKGLLTVILILLFFTYILINDVTHHFSNNYFNKKIEQAVGNNVNNEMSSFLKKSTSGINAGELSSLYYWRIIVNSIFSIIYIVFLSYICSCFLNNYFLKKQQNISSDIN